MNLKKLKTYSSKASALALGIVICGVVACNKNNSASPANSIGQVEGSSNSQRTSTANRFLTFNNLGEFHTQLNSLLPLDNAALESWETSRSFRSLRSGFEAIVEAEEALSARLDSLPVDSSAAGQSAPIQHSDQANAFKQTYVVLKEGDASFFEPNINNYSYSYLTNTFGIVKIGVKIYQFTRDYVKTIDDGDAAKIPLLISSTESKPSRKITVIATNSGYIENGRVSSTSTFVRSSIGNNGRARTIVYQDWVQNISSSQPNKRVTSYKVRVRSLVRRLRGAWYDNKCRNLSLSGNTNGNITYGQLANNAFVTINWSFGISNSTSSARHTWDYFLPNKDGMNQTLNALVTDGFHPQLFSSSITGNASGGASATTTYP